ncbi:MAG: MlaD family protein [Desulfobulbales bacterium]
MSKEVNRIAIGGFVVGGIGLAVLAILLFGSGKFFEQKSRQVLFFQGSVQGLSVGSPVKFRGVDIGTVTDIELTINPDDLEFYVPVYVEIFSNRISILGGGKLGRFSDEEALDTLVQDMGLRAQLQMESLLTGQLFIDYDFYPDAPIRKVGLEKKVYEIPTIPTTLQMLTETIEQIMNDIRQVNIKELVENIAQTAKGANELLNSPDLQEAVVNLKAALKDVQRFVKNADALAGKIDGRVDSVADSFETTMQDTRKLVQNIDTSVAPLISGTESALTSVRTAFTEVESLLHEAEKMIAENSKLRRDITATLESMSDASRSLEDLTDYLQQHPESIISGKN